MGIAGIGCGRAAEIIFTIWVTYSAYANLVQHRLTRLGFDAFIMGLIGLVAGKEVATAARQDQRVIKRMAIMMSLVAVGGIWDIVVFIIGYG